MNDNNNQVKQQLSEEELQRTQVLNFDDFKETARIEKIGNKKPAIIIAIIGIVSILLGTNYNGIKSLVSKKNEEPKQNVQTRKQEKKEEKVKINCTKSNDNSDGTTEKIVVNFELNGDSINTYEKTYTLTIIPGSINGATSLQKFKDSLTQYIIQKDGYDLSSKDIENGIEVTTKVDYDKININDIPQQTQDNYRFNVTYLKNSTKDQILEDMKNQKFSCV